MEFSCEPTETRDESGRLEAIGVRWTEARLFSESAVHFVGGCLYFGGLAAIAGGLISFLFKNPNPGFIGLGLALLPLSFVACWLGWRVPGRDRELSFWPGGLIYAPFGFSTYGSECDRLKLPHTGVASIEAEQLVFPKGNEKPTYTHGVRIFFRNGQVAHIASRLEPDDAHMLAVLLTQALMTLREEVASVAHARASRRASRPNRAAPSRPAYVID